MSTKPTTLSLSDALGLGRLAIDAADGIPCAGHIAHRIFAPVIFRPHVQSDREGIVTAFWACGVLGGRVAQRG